MEKHIDKKRSIGMASQELNVEAHTIRYWEEQFPQLTKTVGKGGRRYYYDMDIENLKKIKYLLHNVGYTITGLKNLFKNDRSFFRKSFDDIKNIDKVFVSENINNENISKVVNNLIILKNKFETIIKKLDNFHF